jgi:GT2 family glycosyltransferase
MTNDVPAQIAIIIATAGRPNHVRALVERLERQTRQPAYVLFSCASEGDVPNGVVELCEDRPFECAVFFGSKGTCLQRNRALTWLHRNTTFFQVRPARNIAIFLDDDFVMREDWIEEAARAFERDENVVGVTGRLLADGAVNAGYTEREAAAILSAGTSLLPAGDWRSRPGVVESLYGCNMVFRAATIAGVMFDEKLPLYGWLEDYDFCARLRPSGGLRVVESMIGVHLATKEGRTSGVRYGYSQVANPLYLARKRTLRLRFALKMLVQCTLSNMVKSVAPEPFVDRRGRLAGNFRALADAVFWRLSPQRILSFD